MIRFRKLNFLGLLTIFGLLAFTTVAVSDQANFDSVPVAGTVTMIDLGADKCIPCKMMAPILVKLKSRYEGKAVIEFIDVWKHREQVGRFSIRAIPTQIFFDPNRKEVYRHVGFMSEKEIVAQLEKMGIK